MRLLVLVLFVGILGCNGCVPSITEAQIKRLREVYQEDTIRCRCPQGTVSKTCLPPDRIDAGDRLFEEALRRFQDAE